MALEGKQLGRYRILRLLGSGGMGEVYLAEDPHIGQQVAIKVIRTELTPYPNTQSAQEAARLFQREARAIGKLDHPHVLPLNDYGEAQIGEMALIYLVMPYRPEGSLVTWIRQRYPDQLVPPVVVAHLVGQAAEALQHAHQHQITHQDVKPSNFLIRSNEKTPALPDVLLADFGIARSATSATSSQNLRGTPAYMAPEQTLGEAVPASDQYALAVMAYELLTGRLPFQGNAVRLMYQHLQDAPEPPSAHNPHLPKALDAVMLTALSKRPEERFPSVTAFAADFSNAVQAMDVGEAATIVSAPQAPRITNPLPALLPISDTLANEVTLITPPAEAGALPASGPMEEDAAAPFGSNALALGAALSAADIPAVVTSTPTVPDVPAGPASAAPGVPSAPAGPQAGAPAVPSAPAGVQTGTLASQGVGNVVAKGLLPKLLSLKLVAAVLVTAVVVGGSVAGVVLARQSRSPSSSSSSSSPPGPALSATVIITPASKDLQNTYTLSAVTGTPNASKQQVGARMLSATTPTYTKTVNATGQENIPGTHDHGTVIVSNYDPNNSLSFAAGDTIADEGTCSPSPGGYTGPFDLMFDAPVSLPPDPDPNSPNNPPTASVPGHLVGVGSWGGCFAADIYCASYGCYAEVEASNNFGGGQEPYNGPDVQQSDIDGAESSLIQANQPDPQQMLQPQIKPNEQLVGTPQCTPKTSANHKAGDRVAQVTVKVSFTCTGEVYDHDGALAMAANLLTQQAATDPGGGYALVGKITTAVTNAAANNQGTVMLTVSAEGVWAYQFSDAQKQSLAQLIAGKRVPEANQTLAAQPGVVKATIQLAGGQTLPTNPAKITIVVQTIPGA